MAPRREVIRPAQHDVSALLKNPSYNPRDFWPDYRSVVMAQTPDHALTPRQEQEFDRVIFEEWDKVKAGNPNTLSQAFRRDEISREELRQIGTAAFRSFGPLNFIDPPGEEARFDWLAKSAVALTGDRRRESVVANSDALIDYFDGNSLATDVKIAMRNSNMSLKQRRTFLEEVAAPVQEAGLNALQRPRNDYYLERAVDLFKSANAVRELRRDFHRESRNGRRNHEIDMYGGGLTESITRRRELDTEALTIHAIARLSEGHQMEMTTDQLHNWYRELQIRNVKSFLGAIKGFEDPQRRKHIIDPGRAAEWWFVLFDNRAVYNHGLYGEHFATYASDYRDNPYYAGLGRKMSHDIYVSDEQDQERTISLFETKLLIPEFLGPRGQFTELKPRNDDVVSSITLFTPEIPLPKDFGAIRGDRLDPKQRKMYHLAAMQYFRSTAKQLLRSYDQEAAMTAPLEREAEERLVIGKKILAVA